MFNLWDFFTFITALIITTIVVEAITEILVASSLLDIIGLRPWAASRVLPADGDYSRVRWYHRAIHKLLTCGYCCSVWVGFVCAWTLPGNYIGLLPWDNIFLKSVLLHRLANWWHVYYELLRRGRVNSNDLELKGSIALEMPNARELRTGDGETGKAP